MEEEFLEQAQAAKSIINRDLRKVALQVSLSMQPTNHAANYGSMAGLQQQGKSITQLLSDSETIYNWLIKDL